MPTKKPPSCWLENKTHLLRKVAQEAGRSLVLDQHMQQPWSTVSGNRTITLSQESAKWHPGRQTDR